jgi:hypothetical protein
MPTSINEPSTPAFEKVAGAVTPTISALEPDTCAIGDPDFDLHVTGGDFGVNTIIYFAGHDEPTTLNEDGTVSTGVKPSLWGAPAVVQCYVRNGTLHSNPMEFTFTEAAAGGTRKGGQLSLDSIDPDSVPITKSAGFVMTVRGEGFSNKSVVVFDDEELPTTYVSKRELIARPAMAEKPGEVDVEVHDGDEMSDVLTFEFTASESATRKEPARKPKKAEPVHKRPKKGKR